VQNTTEPIPGQEQRIAVAIPAFQAAASIGDLVHRVKVYLPHVLVVDDGSQDATAELAAEAGAKVLRQPENMGKGAALGLAFRQLIGAGYDQVLTLDADGQHLPEEIPKLLACSDSGAHLVLGTRDHLFANMSGLRRTSNRLSSRLISKLAGFDLGDIQTGFRLYTKTLLQATGFPESRFEAESAVVVRAGRLGLKVVGIPVQLGQADGRATSHYRPLLDGLRIGWGVAKARLGPLPKGEFFAKANPDFE
jgi:glycosyltransferase involved in cell wall biosynthesis